MKHLLLTRCKFEDKVLMKKYLQVSKKYFAPSVKNQNAKFELGLIINPEDVEFVKNYLDLDFIEFNTIDDFIEKSKDYEIQTRHDIDDWFRFDYIKTIQEQWKRSTKDKLLIQSFPIREDIRNSSIKLLKYEDKRLSMHLTLCQKNPTNHIMEYKHADMYKVTNNVISLNSRLTKWIIHGENISCKR